MNTVTGYTKGERKINGLIISLISLGGLAALLGCVAIPLALADALPRKHTLAGVLGVISGALIIDLVIVGCCAGIVWSIGDERDWW